MNAVDLELHAQELLPETEKLRREVRLFLRQQEDAGVFQPECDAWLREFSPDFSRELGRRGWIGMTWPTIYGGAGRTAVDRFVVTEELIAAGAPVAAHWTSDRQTGSALLRYGSEPQRRKFLPAMARGECYFAVGMSEPDSGSDLASIKTRAVLENGRWTLNGHKIWTSHADKQHFIVLLCRTSVDDGDRHVGLTQFIVDLRAPGISVRPIRLMSGEAHFNEVFIEDVLVDDEMRLGEVDGAWAQVTGELAHERSGPERFLSTFPLFRCLIDAAHESSDTAVEIAAGRLWAEAWVLREFSLRIAGELSANRVPATQGALMKDLGTAFERTVIDTTRAVLQTRPSRQSTDKINYHLATALLNSPAFTIRGGSTEILRGLICRSLGVR